MSTLNQILYTKKGYYKGFIFVTLLIGCSLLFFSIQLYLSVYHILNQNQVQNDRFEYLVVNKKISNLMMGHKQESFFSKLEMEELAQQKSIEKVGQIVSNQFSVEASNLGDISFSTQMFFEAIPDEFLDTKVADFNWHEGENTIPILLSQDFLNLYNFGFALSQGLPQMSEETVKAISFDVLINGTIPYRAEVVGFTQRYTSVIVPISFMNYANQHYGDNNSATGVARLVLKTQEPDNPDLVKFLNEKHYQTQNEKLKWSKIKSIVQLVFFSSELLGIFILSLCIMVIVLFLKIEIIESKERLKLLSLLGYDTKSLQYYFLKPQIIRFGVVIFIALIGTQFFTFYLYNFFKPLKLEVSKFISVYVLSEGVLILLLIYLILFKKSKKILSNYFA